MISQEKLVAYLEDRLTRSDKEHTDASFKREIGESGIALGRFLAFGEVIQWVHLNQEGQND